MFENGIKIRFDGGPYDGVDMVFPFHMPGEIQTRSIGGGIDPSPPPPKGIRLDATVYTNRYVLVDAVCDDSGEPVLGIYKYSTPE